MRFIEVIHPKVEEIRNIQPLEGTLPEVNEQC